METPDGPVLYGASGDKDNTEKFLTWFRSGQKPEEKPEIKRDDGFSAIVIKNGKIYQLNDNLVYHQINKEFWGLGSGTDYAFGAMAAGVSAIDAVHIAISLDINSGMGVDYLEAK